MSSSAQRSETPHVLTACKELSSCARPDSRGAVPLDSLRSVSAGNPEPVGIEQLSGFEDNRWTGFLCLGESCALAMCIRGMAGSRGLLGLGQGYGAGFQQIQRSDRGQHGRVGQDLQGADQPLA